jgi:signal transduction histidine kinase/ligand-binding sensor domain-containing protein/AraC-like DNA-binding protein
LNDAACKEKQILQDSVKTPFSTDGYKYDRKDKFSFTMKILNTAISILGAIMFMTAAASAQTRKFFTPDNGLSNSLLNKVCQDRRGFIWIATEYGLNKFDGISFTVYKNIIADDSGAVVHNDAKTLFEDKDGNLLIGTNNGLLKYNEETDSFSELKIFRDGKRLWPHVTAIVQTADGSVLLAASGQGMFTSANGSPDFHFEEGLTRALSSIYISALCEDDEHNIWTGSENDGLNCYNPRTGNMKTFRYPEIGGNSISAIEKDAEGNVWVGTLTQGLYLYMPSTGRFQRIPHRDGLPICIKSLSVDSHNDLYIGADGQGLMIYNRKSGTIEPYEIHSTPFDFSKGKVHSIMFDSNHNMWLGFYQKGLIFVPVTDSRFEYYGYRSISGNPIGSCSVTTIKGDREGRLWIGTDNDGLYSLNSRGRRIAHYRRTASPHSAPDVVQSIHEDSDGSLWLASYMNGLARLNPKTGYCEYIESFAGVKAFCITADKSGRLLVGTYGSGFHILDKKGMELSRYQSTGRETDQPSEDALPNDWISYIMTDRDGLIWIAHHKGLSCFDPERESFLVFEGRNNLLPARTGRFLMEDDRGRIWAGTSSGLFRFDKNTGEMASWTTADGLPNEVVCGICQDDEKNIWVSTFDGIAKLDANNRFTAYYADDGLQGNEFSHGAAFRDRSGKIYFGGINGVTAFHASQIIERRNGPKVSLTNFYVLNSAVKKGDISGSRPIVETSVLDAETFTLAHNDNTFSFEFSTFDFLHPERIVYQYMMQGVNPEWASAAPGSNRITYNNLAPGEYLFNVKAINANIESEVKVIRIHILPPWYKSMWAFCLYGFIIILLLAVAANLLIARIRFKEKLLEKNHAEKIAQAKLQFFTNISHEIRTPLTLIINPLEQLIRQDNDPARRPAYLIIYRNARRILRLINQMMDMRKLDEGAMKLKYAETDLVPFIQDLMHTFQYQAQTKQIDFKFIHHDEKLNVYIDPNNFDKVLMNILSNAFKFTPDNCSITIALSIVNDNTVEITVTDTGIGIDADKTEKIFEPFYQIENKQTPLHAGTGIGLHLSRSIVELHHGSLTAESNNGTGSRFIIRIPLGNTHLHPSEIETHNAGIIPHSENNSATPIPETPPPPAQLSRAKTKYRILIIDDEEDILQYLNRELSPDYHIKNARNGKEALNIILREKPDLVVSDIMMPEIDGATLSRKIKQNINISHIPIILLTARTSDEERLHGLEMGADAYFAKPFNLNLLKQTIANLLANNERLMNKFSGKELQQDKMPQVEIKSADEILLEKIMKYINANIANPKLNNEMIAAHVGISRVHLFRKLRTLTNQSPREFIRNVRLRQAAALLDGKKLNISEVAYATGFSSPSQFSIAFHTFYGRTPSEHARNSEATQ